jgi:hypothetical protein
MLGKVRNLNIPADLASELFDALIAPALLYGSEVYAPYPHSEIETVHLKFCKSILGVSSRTTNNMVYGELGRMPLEIKVKTRALTYWSRIATGKQTKLSFIIYKLLFELHENNSYSSAWIQLMVQTLNECGLSNVWYEQHAINTEWLKKCIELTLQDQFRKFWSQSLMESTKCKLYCAIKHDDLKFENYLIKLP